MANEVRVHAEGSLRWVQASATTGWRTASAPQSGILAFTEKVSHESGRTLTVIKDRGIPNHFKETERNEIKIDVDVLWTGALPTAASGAGVTVPLYHLELRASAEELGAGSAWYYQYHGVAPESIKVDPSNKDGGKVTLSFKALSMNGPTASGYLS